MAPLFRGVVEDLAGKSSRQNNTPKHKTPQGECIALATCDLPALLSYMLPLLSLPASWVEERWSHQSKVNGPRMLEQVTWSALAAPRPSATALATYNLFPPAGSPQVQVGPEEDRDHLYHPVVEAEAEEPADLGKPLVLSTEVQNGPEKDRDHLYHG